MKKLFLFLIAASLALPFSAWSAEKGKSPTAKPGKSASCASCHEGSSDLLGKGHPEVKVTTLGACLACHKPKVPVQGESNPFSATLHKAHLNEVTALECTTCHTWSPGKSLGLPGQKISYGKPSRQDMASLKRIFVSWAGSGYTDGLHSGKNVTCVGCHGKTLPEIGDPVENERCLQCHGPFQRLLEKSAPKDFPDRNPHSSHLGEIACTVCHKGHAASSVYCLECHRAFKMKIPGE
jgi:hypothetical protein